MFARRVAMQLTRRLRSLLGADWHELHLRHFQGLVDQQVSEDFDLDYKASLYGGSDAERTHLASDVAKFANHQGGLLLLGVEEDGDARARAVPGVALSDAEELRMRSVVASNVFPHPRVEIRRVTEDGQHGVYLLYVSRSPLAPHAVRRNESLRYPVRDGAGTRYLNESEVADAYRSRFAGEDQQVRRLQEIHEEGCRSIPRPTAANEPSIQGGEGTWLAVSLVPNSPGTVPMGISSLERSMVASSDTNISSDTMTSVDVSVVYDTADVAKPEPSVCSSR